MYCEQPLPLWEQCAALIKEHVQKGWHWRYIADEHSSRRVSDALGAHEVACSAGQVLDSTHLHFRDAPVRVAPIIAALSDEVKQALEQGALGVLVLIEMSWAIRTPS
jgi:hypothetical protein